MGFLQFLKSSYGLEIEFPGFLFGILAVCECVSRVLLAGRRPAQKIVGVFGFLFWRFIMILCDF